MRWVFFLNSSHCVLVNLRLRQHTMEEWRKNSLGPSRTRQIVGRLGLRPDHGQHLSWSLRRSRLYPQPDPYITAGWEISLVLHLGQDVFSPPDHQYARMNFVSAHTCGLRTKDILSTYKVGPPGNA